MFRTKAIFFICWNVFGIVKCLAGEAAEDSWTIDSTDEMRSSFKVYRDATIANGMISADSSRAFISTKLKTFEQKREAKSLVIEQSPVWQNWNPTENIGPTNLKDAPVLLTVGPSNYWIFGRYGRSKSRKTRFKSKTVRLEGFDLPLKTTEFPNQFNAPGGLKPSKGGYHAWQSHDMKTWVHHGPVTEGFSKWVTSAEYVDGKALIYYDFPNDQDPHVYLDDDLFDGEPGKNYGLAVNDPSHGSDAGFIRDLDNQMHVILEDWSPINASKRAWDSPLAAHAVSADGIRGFVFKQPPVDSRTSPTGKIGSYNHPHWAKEDPVNYRTNRAEYEIHVPEQEAYGDWAPICIGGRYYLFADYDPSGGHAMSVCWFTAPSINDEFTWCDKIGTGHPDPDVAFAEGVFYLATQQNTDYVSPGPWVEKVEVRVGVDTTRNGEVDQWTDWAEVKETYDFIPGYSKQVATEPAKFDLSELAAGYGFEIQIQLTDSTENKSKPIIDKIHLSFTHEERPASE